METETCKVENESDWFTFNDEDLVKEYNYLEKHVSIKEENEIIDALEDNVQCKKKEIDFINETQENLDTVIDSKVLANDSDHNGLYRSENDSVPEDNKYQNVTEKHPTTSQENKKSKVSLATFIKESAAANNLGSLGDYNGSQKNDDFILIPDDENLVSESRPDSSQPSSEENNNCKTNKLIGIHTEEVELGGSEPKAEEIMYTCVYCLYESTNTTAVTNHLYFAHKEENPDHPYAVKIWINRTEQEKEREQMDKNRKPLKISNAGLEHSMPKLKINYRCAYCSYQSLIKWYTILHMHRVHRKGPIYKCEYCSFESGHKRIVKKHTNSKHTRLTKHLCEYCEYHTTDKSSLKIHIDALHIKRIKHKCTKCSYESFRRSTFLKHVKTVHRTSDVIFKCMHCSFFTHIKESLKRHIRGVHLRHLTDKLFECKACDYKTNNNSNLKDHVNSVHTKEKIYPCDLCSYQGYTASHLIYHRKRHHFEQKWHLCSFCASKFPTLSYLKRHINVQHTKEKFYECSHCTYKTTNPANVPKHVNSVHTKENIYQCLYCEFTATVRFNLNTHINSRHKEKSTDFICFHCDFKTKDKKLFVSHMDSEHKAVSEIPMLRVLR